MTKSPKSHNFKKHKRKTVASVSVILLHVLKCHFFCFSPSKNSKFLTLPSCGSLKNDTAADSTVWRVELCWPPSIFTLHYGTKPKMQPHTLRLYLHPKFFQHVLKEGVQLFSFDVTII